MLRFHSFLKVWRREGRRRSSEGAAIGHRLAGHKETRCDTKQPDEHSVPACSLRGQDQGVAALP